jgi:phenylpropionate dioxygenase-like ring-hydroxylating dioxygenase large terminal subunit
MDQRTQAALIDRVFALADGELGQDLPVTRWPVENYYDPRLFDREMAMFGRQPLPLAHVGQLPEPGDFRVEQVLGRSVMLVHSHSGHYRALLNVCRHRGAEVTQQERGNVRKSFVCPYHAWTYDTDGRLTHLPDRARSFPCLRLEEHGLVELSTEVRHGLLWVTMDVPGTPVEEFLGPELDAELAVCGLSSYSLYQDGSTSRAFNWKTGAESFMESYHFAVLHRRTAGQVFMHNAGAYDQLGPHFRTLAPKKTLRETRSLERDRWTVRGTATIMYLLFPSTALFVEKDHINLLVILPEDAGHCRVKRTHLVQRLSPRLRRYWDANMELFLGAVAEDLDICESMQRGYRSGANTAVTFGRNETGCDAYRRAVQSAMQSDAC